MKNAFRQNLIRMAALAIAGALIVGLVLAAQLKPNENGLGTHQQLGLPPCTARVLFGIRCPSCGMTTSWAHLMNGDFLASGQANLGGLLLGIYSIVTIIVCMLAVRTGRKPAENTQRWAAWGLISIAVVTMAEWIIRFVV